MKRLKSFLPALTLLLVAIGTFSFTSKAPTDLLPCNPEYVFFYDGSGSTTDPSNWNPSSADFTPADCPNATDVCAIVVCAKWVNFDEEGIPVSLKVVPTNEIGLAIIAADAIDAEGANATNGTDYIIFLRTAFP